MTAAAPTMQSQHGDFSAGDSMGCSDQRGAASVESFQTGQSCNDPQLQQPSHFLEWRLENLKLCAQELDHKFHTLFTDEIAGSEDCRNDAAALLESTSRLEVHQFEPNEGNTAATPHHRTLLSAAVLNAAVAVSDFIMDFHALLDCTFQRFVSLLSPGGHASKQLFPV